MIKAYNETWVDNLEKQDKIGAWQKQQKLTAEESQLAFSLFPVLFYQPNFFVKIGLFLFSLVAISATWGFLYIFVLEPVTASQAAFGSACLMYAVLLFILLEVTIKKNKYYRSGTDNALLYAALIFLLVAIFAFTNFEWQNWTYCCLAILLLTPALVRYGDPVIAPAIFINVIAVLYIWMTKSDLGKTVLPFVLMAVSALVYFTLNYWKIHSKTSYYTDAQEVLLTFALATFYIGGNYYVAREGNAIFNNLQTSVQINLAFVFYFFTFAIPVVFIVTGLKRRSRQFFVVGVASAVISVLTCLHYFSTIAGEWESTIGGILLVLLAISTIKLLKEPKGNVTSEADDNENPKNFEALIISQITQPSNANQDGLSFGEGDFGGGGSGSEY